MVRQPYMGCRGTTALRVRLPCLGNRLDRQADGVDADGGHGEGEVLEVALVGLDAVDEALVVVVDGGGGSREGVEVAEEGVAAVFEVAMLPVELTEEDGGDVEIGKGGGADIGVEDVGGGVGVAPLLYLGHKIHEMGGVPTFLLGARSAHDLLEIDRFRAVGRVFLTTEDGSEGERGFVTNHSILAKEQFTRIATCGPKPMMVAVARMADKLGIACEASLENMMACGVGACLCCVEKTTEGNLCVCKEGPVFDTKRLLW